MKKTLLISFTLLLSLASFSQIQDSLYRCTSTFKVNGVYIFIGTMPTTPYESVTSMPISIDWNGNALASLEKGIKKCRYKNPHFNGMIFNPASMRTVELIHFKGTQIRRGGFGIGDEVSFIAGGKAGIKGGEQKNGYVVQLWPEVASVKYIDDKDKEQIKRVPYKKLVLVSRAE
jgi:hypothetical protein